MDDLCERPSREISRLSILYPGRFEQGPEEKFGLVGFRLGFTILPMVSLNVAEKEPGGPGPESVSDDVIA
jgi:hypothetical protein